MTARDHLRARWRLVAVARFAALTLACVAVGTIVAQQVEFAWNIPSPFPRPPVPADNPMSVAKVELGRRLFYDTRLSVNGKQSCGSCHQQERAFTDGRARAIGTTGELHARGSMTLANVAYNPALTWANPLMQSLEEQALVPMLGIEPIELGLGGQEAKTLSELSRDSLYQLLFPRAFADARASYTMTHVVEAIAAFERTIISMRSPYDRYRYGNEQDAISASAKRGESFFFSGQRGSCFQCHSGWNFNGAIRYEGRTDAAATFFNTGLYNVAGAVSYPLTNTGVHQVTGKAEDIGKFRVPTLRNIAVTAPYMHDGSIKTLSEVLDHYAAGGRTLASGPYAGVGRDNPNKALNLRGFTMTAEEKQDLIAFLETLTDTTMLRNPALSNPWKPVPPARAR